jgi:hypothetical protein
MQPALVFNINTIQLRAQLHGALPRHHQACRAVKPGRPGWACMPLFGRLARHSQSAHVRPSFGGAIGAVPGDALTKQCLLSMIAGIERISIFFHFAPSAKSGQAARPLGVLGEEHTRLVN